MPKILTIEDSAVERQTIVSILKKAGYEILEAGTAEKGLEIIKKEDPDLILLDIRLPGMDGVTFCKELTKLNRIFNIISVSVVGREDTIKECKEHGVKAYIMKPITEKKLLSAVRNVLGKK